MQKLPGYRQLFLTSKHALNLIDIMGKNELLRNNKIDNF